MPSVPCLVDNRKSFMVEKVEWESLDLDLEFNHKKEGL